MHQQLDKQGRLMQLHLEPAHYLVPGLPCALYKLHQGGVLKPVCGDVVGQPAGV